MLRDCQPLLFWGQVWQWAGCCAGCRAWAQPPGALGRWGQCLGEEEGEEELLFLLWPQSSCQGCQPCSLWDVLGM